MGKLAMATSSVIVLPCLLMVSTLVNGVSVDPDLEQEVPIRPEAEDGLFVFPSMNMAGGGLVRVVGHYHCNSYYSSILRCSKMYPFLSYQRYSV